MEGRWFKRRAHIRHLSHGGSTTVRESWVLLGAGSSQRRGSYRRKYPRCGAPVISVNMRNGGWAHFEGAKGLTRVKHPCMHIGEGLSRKRDENTPDLFDVEECE